MLWLETQVTTSTITCCLSSVHGVGAQLDASVIEVDFHSLIVATSYSIFCSINNSAITLELTQLVEQYRGAADRKSLDLPASTVCCALCLTINVIADRTLSNRQALLEECRP